MTTPPLGEYLPPSTLEELKTKLNAHLDALEAEALESQDEELNQ